MYIQHKSKYDISNIKPQCCIALHHLTKEHYVQSSVNADKGKQVKTQRFLINTKRHVEHCHQDELTPEKWHPKLKKSHPEKFHPS